MGEMGLLGTAGAEQLLPSTPLPASSPSFREVLLQFAGGVLRASFTRSLPDNSSSKSMSQQQVLLPG